MKQDDSPESTYNINNLHLIEVLRIIGALLQDNRIALATKVYKRAMNCDLRTAYDTIKEFKAINDAQKGQ